jgi:hypothetical protein
VLKKKRYGAKAAFGEKLIRYLSVIGYILRAMTWIKLNEAMFA